MRTDGTARAARHIPGDRNRVGIEAVPSTNRGAFTTTAHKGQSRLQFASRTLAVCRTIGALAVAGFRENSAALRRPCVGILPKFRYGLTGLVGRIVALPGPIPG